MPSFDLGQKITLHQMFSYFTDAEDGEITLDDGLQDLAGECKNLFIKLMISVKFYTLLNCYNSIFYMLILIPDHLN